MLPTTVDEELEELKGWRFVQYGDANSLKHELSEAANGGKKGFSSVLKIQGQNACFLPSDISLVKFFTVSNNFDLAYERTAFSSSI